MTQALTTVAPQTTALATAHGYSREQVDLIKRTICKGASDDELQLFMQVAQRTGLDPFARQIFAIKVWDNSVKDNVMQPVTSIDGFRLIAARTGRYGGQSGPFWCGTDKLWHDVWLDDEPPCAAKVLAHVIGQPEPTPGTAHWRSYARRKKDGKLMSMWEKMPEVMLAKCAEALALRRAFPAELSGLYTADEMAQAQSAPASEPRAKIDIGAELDKVWACESEAELRALGATFTDLPAKYREELRDAWRERMAEIKSKQVEQESLFEKPAPPEDIY